MKHRSPLLTLAAVAVAFAIMFTVDMLSGPPGSSSTAADPPVALASANASNGSPQRIEFAVVSPSNNASQTRGKDGSAAIAEAVLGDQVAADFGDGRNVASWYGAPITEPTSPWRARAPRSRAAALYRARRSKTTIGWIVFEDGSQVGVQTTGTGLAVGPELDAENPAVTVEGGILAAELVSGDEDL
ncbi:MAG: hypothetical protein ACRDPL_14405 [Propionibacteriaceae bacterium]